MSTTTTIIINLVLYSALCAFVYFILGKMPKKKHYLLSLAIITIIAILFTVYNVYSTETSIGFGYDRSFYAKEYNVGTSTTTGMTVIMNLIKFITPEVKYFFYFTSFICCFLHFVAYRMSANKKRLAAIFIMSTIFVISLTTHLKQAYAMSFASLFFVILMEKPWKYKDIACILLIAIACLFHQMGFILIPIYIFSRLVDIKKIKFNPKTFLITLGIVFLLFIPIAELSVNLTSGIAPSLSTKLAEYFGANNIHSYNIISGTFRPVFLKGLPFYLITILGFAKRNELVKKIKNYDLLLIYTSVGSFLFLASIYSYWLYRFIGLFYLPFGILFNAVLNQEKNRKKQILILALTLGFNFIFLYREIAMLYINFGGF